jgi:hypothetical protein
VNASHLDIQPTSYGQRIALPNRDLGDATIFGWVVVLFGVIGGLFMLTWIGGPVAIGIGMLLQGEWFGCLFIGFGMLGLSGLFVSLKILAAGIAIVRNLLGCEIRITDSQIISREKFGWFSHKIKIDRDKIESLYLRSMMVSEDEDDARTVQIDWITKRLPYQWYGIVTQSRRGMMIAGGYPLQMLQQVAEILKSELDRNRVGLVSIVQTEDGSSGTTTVQEPISIVKQTSEDVEAVTYELPDDSTIEVIDQADAKVYRVPPQGVWKGSHGLMVFAVIWNVILALVIFGMLKGGGPAGEDWWFSVAIVSMLAMAGVGMFIGAFYLGRQSALVGVRDGMLFIERKTIFGTKWTEFEQDKIASVHIGAGSMEVNDVPIKELKIQPVGEIAVGMFSQLDDEEIRWLAQQLSKELDLRPETSSLWQRFLDPDNPVALPETSRVTVDRSAGETTITIPKQKLEGCWMLTVMGWAFSLGSLPVAIACIWNFEASFIFIPIAIIGTFTGAGMLVANTIYSTRWFRLNVNPSQITIERHGFLSDRSETISKENIRSVEMHDSGTKVNGRTYMDLAIKSSKPSESFTLMSGRDEREIAYVAALIHQTMGLVEENALS